jgi:hypothetical protein
MSLHKIPDELVEKYGLGKPGEELINCGGAKMTLKRSPTMKAPFTGYNLVWREDGLYIEIPDGVDKIITPE